MRDTSCVLKVLQTVLMELPDVLDVLPRYMRQGLLDTLSSRDMTYGVGGNILEKELHDRFDLLEGEIEDLKRQILSRFGRLEKKLDQLSGRLRGKTR